MWAVALRDGTEAVRGSADNPLVWMLRRALGRPSRARARAPWEVARSRVAAAAVALAGSDPERLRTAAVTWQAQVLVELHADLGPLGAALH